MAVVCANPPYSSNEFLNGWLFGVDVVGVRPEIKDRLTEYQRNCFKVLAAYFIPEGRPDIADLIRDNIEVSPPIANDGLIWQSNK